MNDRFFENLEETAQTVFAEALGEFGAENLCGFALYTDESAMTILASVNTEENLLANWAESPDYKEDFRWSPPEWTVEDYDSESFDSLNQELVAEARKTSESGDFLTRRQNFFDGCVKALEKVREKVPTNISKNFVLVFAVSDFTEPETEINWAKRLNGAEMAELFEKWRRSF